jgi:hypothetical protein
MAPTLPFELGYLRLAGEKILAALLPPKEARSRIIVTLLREILVCRVLQPVIEQLSDPDTMNQAFIYLVAKLAQNPKSYEIDAAFLEEFGTSGTLPAQMDSEIGTYEDFMSQVTNCDSLLDAFRIRDSIETEILQRKAEISMVSYLTRFNRAFQSRGYREWN